MVSDVSAPTRSHQKLRNPLAAIVDLFDSVWLGIALIILIFAYSAVGSAVPTFRQFFELTEFQYFNHPIFAALIILFCVNLIVTTLRRIPFTLRNLGVLTVHTGLLTLCAGSIIYFGRKIEGDVWLDAPRVAVISLDRLRGDVENALIGQLVAVKGETWETNIPMLGGKHRVEVLDVKHDGLATGRNVRLRATLGSADPIEITLSSERTETMLAKINDRLGLMLRPANVTDTFYDETTPMLSIRLGAQEHRFELPSLPYYSERFVSGVDDIRDLDGKLVNSNRITALRPVEHWQMPISLDDPDSAMAADWPISLTIDGFLPYAKLEPRPIPGSGERMPLARVSLSSMGQSNTDWLVSSLPDQAMMELASGPSVEFIWTEADTMDPEWTRPLDGRHVLDVWIRDKNIHHSYDLTAGQEIPVEGSDYKLKVQELRPSWPLMSPGFQNAKTPIALVWLDGPTKKFQRSVLQRFPQLNQDRDDQGKKIDPSGALVDTNIELRYFDASQDRFLIAAGPHLAPTVVHTAPGGKRTVQKLELNQAFAAASGTSVRLHEFIERPEFVTQAVVVPTRSRRNLSSVRRGESLIRVRLASREGNWSRHVWVPFSLYNTQHDGTKPTVAHDVPGVGDIELVYGRAWRPLPGHLALERLQTDYYPGRQQASMWTSYLRKDDPETGDVRQAKAWLNNTARIGEWTLFQSQAPNDGKSWTVLGVGNRQGVMTMLLGCTLITLGMMWAFCVKPVLVRRRRRAIEQSNRRDAGGDSRSGDSDGRVSGRSSNRKSVPTGVAVLALLAVLFTQSARAAEAAGPQADLLKIQSQLDVARLGRLAVQHQWRYATVDSWARDAVKSIHGAKNMLELDPVVAAVELMFNVDNYHATPVIYIKDGALRRELTAHPVQLTDDERRRIFTTGMVSHDFLDMPAVAARIKTLAGDTLRKTAMDRLENAINYYERLGATFTIVPHPQGQHDTPWASPMSIVMGSPDDSLGLAPDQAARIRDLTMQWRTAWLARDAAAINAAIAKLEQTLPTLASQGVYPSEAARAKEVTYRRANLLRWAWIVYIAAFFVSIFAVATGYGWVRVLGLVFLIGAIGLHGYDIAMRWQVIGRIPVANMFEAVVSSTFAGAVFGLLLELGMKKRVFLLGSALLGFFALSLPEILPDKIDDKLTTMMPILDDIMLRIHTVLIISSYAVITLAYGVANCYLFVAAIRQRSSPARATIGAQIGAITILALAKGDVISMDDPTRFVLIFISSIVGSAFLIMGLCSAIWGSAVAVQAAGPGAAHFPVRRNLLEEFDLSHRVLLYTATITLFVGLVLGAIWADYSWGRPWGWDPKEVFALCTWLIYAILIHAKFVTRHGPLWTSVLSVVGFAAMQFNWWVVNFYIVGLHSYA